MKKTIFALLLLICTGVFPQTEKVKISALPPYEDYPTNGNGIVPVTIGAITYGVNNKWLNKVDTIFKRNDSIIYRRFGTEIKFAISSFDGAYTSLTGVPSTFTPAAHTHTLSNITQSGATLSQVMQWNGTAWVAADIITGMSSFNGRSGAVSLFGTDVTTALGYTPVNHNGTALQYFKANGVVATFPTNVSSFSNDAAYLQTETDPVFLASSAYSITGTQKNNWDNAFSWGNHASAGYASDASVVHKTGSETIAGIKTFSSPVIAGITGNSATATQLQTARNIAGIAFDGTSNISLTSGSGIQKGNGTGGLTAAIAETDYITPTGSGALLTGVIKPTDTILFKPKGDTIGQLGYVTKYRYDSLRANTVKRVGMIYDKTPVQADYSTASPNSTFTWNAGTNVTFSGTGSTTGTNYITYNQYRTGASTYAKPVYFTTSATSGGIGTGIRAYRQSASGNMWARYDFNTRLLYIEDYTNSVVNLKATSTAALALPAGTDQLKITFVNTGVNWYAEVQNLNSPDNVVMCRYTDPLTYGGTFTKWSSGEPAVFHFGGTVSVVRDAFRLDELSQPSVLFIGNSIYAGAYSQGEQYMLFNRIKAQCPDGAVLLSGGSNLTQDGIDLLPELLSIKSRVALWELGVNDLIGNLDSATVTRPNILNFIRTCRANGIIPIVTTITPVGSSYVGCCGITNATLNTMITNHNAWLTSISGTVIVINTNTNLKSGGNLSTSYDAGDFIHLNAAGNEVVANDIIPVIKSVVPISSNAVWLPIAGYDYIKTSGTAIAISSATMTSGTVETITSSNAAAPLTVTSSGTATGTGAGVTITNSKTGTTLNNALTINSSGATTNNAIITTAGSRVGFGTATPAMPLSVVGSVSTANVGVNIVNTAADGYQSLFIRGSDANSLSGLGLASYNSTYATSGVFQANASHIGAYGSGGLNIHANDAAGSIKFYTAGNASTNLRAVISAAGALTVGLSGTTTGVINLPGATSGTVTQTVAAAAGTWSFTWPTSAGTANYFLQTNGSGVSTWAKPTTAITGATTNSTATAGDLGETVRSAVTTYTNYSTSATYQNIASITLTAGNWNIRGFGTFSSNASTLTAASNAIFLIGTATASATGSIEGESIVYVPQATLLGTSLQSVSVPDFDVKLTSTTTYYFNTQSTYTVGNPQFVGTISAVRIR